MTKTKILIKFNVNNLTQILTDNKLNSTLDIPSLIPVCVYVCTFVCLKREERQMRLECFRGFGRPMAQVHVQLSALEIAVACLIYARDAFYTHTHTQTCTSMWTYTYMHTQSELYNNRAVLLSPIKWSHYIRGLSSFSSPGGRR